MKNAETIRLIMMNQNCWNNVCAGDHCDAGVSEWLFCDSERRNSGIKLSTILVFFSGFLVDPCLEYVLFFEFPSLRSYGKTLAKLGFTSFSSIISSVSPILCYYDDDDYLLRQHVHSCWLLSW